MRVVTVIDRYCRSVVDGRTPAGAYHRLACARHLRDRSREGTKAFPYRFENGRAERFLRFASQLKHYKGIWAGKPILLRPHQQFRLGSLFAWTHVTTCLRRFRTCYFEIPRKNGKSLEAAIVALYVTFFDGEAGAEGYCIATKREQAKIVWRDCKQLVERSGLRTRILVLAANLSRERTASKLEPLGADKDSTDGLNPCLIINDEFHAQKTRGLIDVMETATGAREQPVNFQITTAGSEPMTPCGDQHDYATKILDGILQDETFFAFIAHADAEDDWTQEATWRKANPNYGVSVRPADLRALAAKAIHMPPAAAAFKQKRLNLWVHAITPWLSLEGWRRGQSRWTLDTLRGRACWIGVDMSSKIDLTAIAACFPPVEVGDRWRFVLWTVTPEETLDVRAQRDRAPYRLWEQRGWLRTNPGNRIDQDMVRAIVNDARDVHGFDVREVGFDPWNAGNIEKDLRDDGHQVVEVPQNVQQMSQPCKEFEADVLDALVDAGDNKLLEWCVSNVIVLRDNKDNIYPTKKRSRGRIDPIVAALIARKLAARVSDEEAADDPDLVVA
jgi:phage terminase large subunit-like protein